MTRKRFALLWLAITGAFMASAAFAAWDRTKPADGSLRVAAEVRNNFQALERGVGGQQVVADNGLEVWAAGDAAAPTYYTLAGAGAAVARTGTGLADTSRKFSRWGAKVTSAAAAAQLYQDLLSAASWDTGFRGLSIACGGYVKASTTSTARLYTYDGTTTTSGAYHTGDGSFQWLTVTGTVGAAVNGPLRVGMDVATGTKVGILQALTCVLGNVAPQSPQLSAWTHSQFVIEIAGAQTTGTGKERFRLPGRGGVVEDVQVFLGTAPTGASFIVDLNTWDGAAFTSMFSTRPTVTAAAFRANAAPDSTYARRCYVGMHGTSVAAGGELTLDIDQVGSGVAGSDLALEVRYRHPVRALDSLGTAAE